jgi:hypothetical protein
MLRHRAIAERAEAGLDDEDRGLVIDAGAKSDAPQRACGAAMGLHRFIHTLDVFGSGAPVIPYADDQVDTSKPESIPDRRRVG